MQVKDVYEINNVLNELAQEKLPGILAWEVSEVAESILPIIERTEKVKKEIQDKYVLRHKDDNSPVLKEIKQNETMITVYDFGENEEIADKEMAKVFEKEIENDFPTITKAELLKINVSVRCVRVLKKYNIVK
jgi:hypothetical protein